MEGEATVPGMNLAVEEKTQSATERKPGTVKGSCAQFLRHNPRFINEPICHVLPTEWSTSMADCMHWTQEDSQCAVHSVPHSNDSTSRSDYQPPSSDHRLQPLKKHRPPDNITAIAPLTNNSSPVKVKERISFRHQYNSRTNPSEPVRGKLHGSFVWEEPPGRT